MVDVLAQQKAIRLRMSAKHPARFNVKRLHLIRLEAMAAGILQADECNKPLSPTSRAQCLTGPCRPQAAEGHISLLVLGGRAPFHILVHTGVVARNWPVHIATEQLQNRRPYLTLSTEPPFGSKRDPVGLPAGD